MLIRIRTPSRLHFGLLGWGLHASRQFGGVGLMVDDPGLEITVSRSERWESTGPIAPRALEVAAAVARQVGDPGPFRVDVARAPEAHVGLGVGTQLSLAVAGAVAELTGRTGVPVETLARWTGRGRRSGVGLYGFAEGGLIIDGGHPIGRDLPTRLVHLRFPETWSVLVVRPPSPPGLHGPAERAAFQDLPPVPAAQTDRLCRLVLLDLLPAVVEMNLPAFGSALAEIQRVIGGHFAPVQGGRFLNAEVAVMAEAMSRLGLQGVGQSSWGPTLYGFTDQSPDTHAATLEHLIRTTGLPPGTALWTVASPAGARREVEANHTADPQTQDVVATVNTKKS